eukprot:scaffold13482_cov79-Isochrysis_galbana.AAC.3
MESTKQGWERSRGRAGRAWVSSSLPARGCRNSLAWGEEGCHEARGGKKSVCNAQELPCEQLYILEACFIEAFCRT